MVEQSHVDDVIVTSGTLAPSSRPRSPVGVSVLLAAILLPAVAYGLFSSTAYRGYGQDLVLGSRAQDALTAIVVPLLVWVSVRSRRGSLVMGLRPSHTDPTGPSPTTPRSGTLLFQSGPCSMTTREFPSSISNASWSRVDHRYRTPPLPSESLALAAVQCPSSLRRRHHGSARAPPRRCARGRSSRGTAVRR